MKTKYNDGSDYQSDATLLAIAEAIAALTPRGIEILISQADSAWLEQPKKRVRFWQNLTSLFYRASDPKLMRTSSGAYERLAPVIERAKRLFLDVRQVH